MEKTCKNHIKIITLSSVTKIFGQTFIIMKSDKIIDKIRLKLEQSNPEQRTVFNIFQFNFTDVDGKVIKSMVFDFKKLHIYEGRTELKDGEITIADEDFYAVGTKQCAFDDLISTNKVLMNGDTSAINKMLIKFRMSQ